MLIGNGLLAKNFSNYEDDENIVIFASGVSNSLEERDSEFIREKQLLLNSLQKNDGKLFVYFSTCSMYEPVLSHRKYTKHKKDMEQAIIEYAGRYAIFRLPQVVGNTGNKHTLLNYLINNLKSSKHFEIWKNASRNFIDIDDITKIVDKILTQVNKNIVINLASPFTYKLLDIVEIIETEVNIKGNYTVVNKGESYNIDISELRRCIPSLDALFGDDYLQKLLHKYYIASEK